MKMEPGISISKTEMAFQGKYYKLIQFYEHPNGMQKANLAANGTTLLAYLPHYAWLAEISENVNIHANDPNIRSIIDIPIEYKLSKAIQQKIFPAHAITGQEIKVNITLFSSVDIDKAIERLVLMLFNRIEKTEQASVLQMQVPINRLNELALLPFVQFIEPIEPTPAIEIGFDGSLCNQRGNYLASEQINGLHYDGTGVTVLVNEGGIIDPTLKNDFKGRHTELTSDTSVSGHKSGVAQRIGSYGNDNPLDMGMAYGANIKSSSVSTTQALTTGSQIVNMSYGYGCYISTYNGGANTNDALVYNNPSYMLAYSAGNEGGTDCGLGAGTGWGTITGAVKQAKNLLTIGSVNSSDNVSGFSSYGPTPDGRIKPDFMAVGPGGTSHAVPNASGGFAQLYHAYQDIYSAAPAASLIKAIMQNTADDVGNPGPDFRTGYGRMNLRRAYNTISAHTFNMSSVANGVQNVHNINVPAGTKQVRVMLYWADYPGTPGSAIALVNNLDLSLTTPDNTVYLPWVLDHTINPANLNAPATRAVDALNNVEQVTLDNPIAGNYQVKVNGTSIPQGGQQYFIVYEFLQDEVTLTYPIGGESFVAGETQRIYWDSYGNTTETFSLQFSTNEGNSWSDITTGLPNSARYYDWAFPNLVTGKAKIRVIRTSASSASAEPFSIIGIPTNLNLVWSCADSLKLSWNAVNGATGYEVYKLGTKYMTSVGTTSSLHKTITGVSTTQNEYFAVRALGTDNAKGRRTHSFEKIPGDINCVPFEAGAVAITSHPSGYLPDCYYSPAKPISIQIQNIGSASISSLSLSFQINGGSVQTENYSGPPIPSGDFGTHQFSSPVNMSSGTYNIKVWINNGGLNLSNDTVSNTLVIYGGGSGAYPYSQNFDGFTICSTSSACNATVCNLGSNWYNVPYDTQKGDDADWRTYSGTTPTGGGYPTGPAGDHTTGNGKYLYAETSVGAGCNNGFLHALSPCINLSTAINPELSFWYSGYGSSIGEMHVDILVDGIWINDITTPQIGNQGSAWKEIRADLTAYVGEKVLFRFRGKSGNGFQGDMAFDDVSIREMPVLSFSGNTDYCVGNPINLVYTGSAVDSIHWIISDGTNTYNTSGNTFSSSSLPIGTYSILIQGWKYGNMYEQEFDNSFVIHNYPNVDAGNDQTFCQGEQATLTGTGDGVLTWNNGVQNAVPFQALIAGPYVLTATGIGNCVRTDTIDITINTVNTNVTQTGNLTLQSQANNAQYQWIDCINGTNLPQTSPGFTATNNGSFAVIVTQNGCTDTSTCISIYHVAIEENIASQWNIFPNPANTYIHVSGIHTQVFSIKIIDISGKTVYQSSEQFMQEATIQVEHLASGVYQLQILSDGEMYNYKVIKK